MVTTIDSGGRIVIPKAVRDAANIRPGTPLQVRWADGRIEIAPSPVEIEVERRDGVAVAKAVEPVPVMAAETVEGVRDDLRHEQADR